MANNDAPRGFKLLQGEGKVVRTRDYAKTASAVIYEGDLLMRVPAGTVQPYVKGTIATAGRVIGVAVAASAAADTDPVKVIDDPEATFVAQVDGATAFAVADAGMNADIQSSPSPDTDLNRSGQVIDMSTKAVTATLPVKVFGLANQINAEENSAAINADVVVKINSTERAAGVAGI